MFNQLLIGVKSKIKKYRCGTISERFAKNGIGLNISTYKNVLYQFYILVLYSNPHQL